MGPLDGRDTLIFMDGSFRGPRMARELQIMSPQLPQLRSARMTVVLTLILLATCASATHAETVGGLQRILQKLTSVSNIRFRIDLVVDPNRSFGNAAINGNHQRVVIWVHPYQLQRKSTNTWAFVLAHELCHIAYSLPGTSARNEWEADKRGARIAIDAGYDLGDHVRGMLSEQNSCTQSHGCWHDRARRLAEIYSLEIKDQGHDQDGKHTTMIGFPPPDELRQADQLQSPGGAVRS